MTTVSSTPDDSREWMVISADSGRLLAQLDPSDPAALRCWSLMRSGASVDAILDALLANGLPSLPSFALVLFEDGSARAVVRGDAEVSVMSGNRVETLTSAGATTWREVTIAGDPDRIRLTAGVAADGEAPDTPGVRIASAVTVVLREPAPATEAVGAEDQPEAATPGDALPVADGADAGAMAAGAAAEGSPEETASAPEPPAGEPAPEPTASDDGPGSGWAAGAGAVAGAVAGAAFAAAPSLGGGYGGGEALPAADESSDSGSDGAAADHDATPPSEESWSGHPVAEEAAPHLDETSTFTREEYEEATAHEGTGSDDAAAAAAWPPAGEAASDDQPAGEPGVDEHGPADHEQPAVADDHSAFAAPATGEWPAPTGQPVEAVGDPSTESDPYGDPAPAESQSTEAPVDNAPAADHQPGDASGTQPYGAQPFGAQPYGSDPYAPAAEPPVPAHDQAEADADGRTQIVSALDLQLLSDLQAGRPEASFGPPSGQPVAGPPAPAAPPQEQAVLVQAVSCERGHLNPLTTGICRVCGIGLRAQLPVQVPRPPLGVLRLSTGDVVPLDRGVVIGRNPDPADASAGPQPHVVAVPSPNSDISRTHVEISLDGWNVMLRDLDSTNGTVVTVRWQGPRRLQPNEVIAIEPGTMVSMADEVTFVYEAAV